MKIRVEARELARTSVDLLALPLVQRAGSAKLPAAAAAVDEILDGQISTVRRLGGFEGKRDQSTLLYRAGRSGPKRVLLIGLGPERELDAERLRLAAGTAVAAAHKAEAKSLALSIPTSRKLKAGPAARALAEGATLASYRSDGHKQEPARSKLAQVLLLAATSRDLGAAREGVETGTIVGESQNLARHLSNEPPNLLTPVALAREARKLARQVGLRCRVMEPAELKRRGMGAMLAVGQGSANPPRLVVLEHRPAKRGARTVCVVGKGITFDSGGISIKPGAGMQDMKHDMSGAATVVGLMRAVALLEVPLHVVGVLAAAENLPGGGAYRPGDILTSMSGLTIEIQNTDAEGRLVLCDALHFVCKEYEPAAVVDLATLTGACVVALGPWTSGLFSNNDTLAETIREAGERSGERVWPMPMWDEHRDHMKSPIADLKNVGGRDAGASTAAAFLSRFVGDTPWAHLDIAGTAWTAKKGPYQPFGATGVGVRLLSEALMGWPRHGLD